MSLELTIGANVQPAITAIQQMKDNLKSLKDQLSKTTDPTEYNKLTNAIVNQKNQLQQALASTNAFANSTFGVSRAARIAHNDLDQAARSIDLFSHGSEGAIDGVSNLVFTFERLQGSTGSTNGALAAMGEAFLGPAGIILAIGTALPLLEKLVSGLFDSGEEANRAKEALAGYNETLENVKKGIEGVKSALDFGNQLGALNVKIFNQGDLENLQQQSVAQRELTQKIIDSRATLQAQLDDLDKNESLSEKDRIEIRQKTNAAILDTYTQETESTRKQTLIYRQIALQRVTDQKDSDDKLNAQIKKSGEERARLAKEEAARLKSLFVVFAPPTKLDVPSLTNEHSFFDALKADVNKQIKPVEIQVPVKVQLHLDQRAQQIADFKKQIEDEASIISETLVNTFSAIGEGIGSAIAGGGIKDFFSGIFKVIGEGLKQLGKYVIASSALIKSIKAALNAALIGNPIAGVVAGVALVALGTAIEKSLPKFAQGGIVNKPTLGIFGEAGPEVVMPLDKLKGMLAGIAGNNLNVDGEFKLKGPDLVLAINRTQRTQGRGG